MYDIIFSDYDGTLYGSSGKVSQKTINSIQKYVAQGGKFVISTGRIYASILPVAKKLGLSGDIITSQGAEIYNIASNSNIMSTRLDTNRVVEILTIAKKEGCLAQCYYNNQIFADENKEFNNFFTQFFDMDIVAEKNLLDKVSKGLINPCKFEVLIDKDKINDFVKKMSEQFPEFLFSKSAPVRVEIADKKATKGKAIEFLLDKYNIKSENAVAIGDGNNDITMLEAVGLKVAVNNSAKKLLSIADYVTTSDGDGVSELIDMLLRGEDIK